MNITPIIKELRKYCKPLKGNVGGAVEWAGLSGKENLTLPAAYVVPLNEDAGENLSSVGYQQTITNHFAVLLVIGQRDVRGQVAYEQFNELKKSVFHSILSWDWDDQNEYFTPIVYEGATLIYQDASRMVYQLEFAFDSYLDTSDTRQGVNLEALTELKSMEVRVNAQDNGQALGLPEVVSKVTYGS